MLTGAIWAHQPSLELTASSSSRLLTFKGKEDLRVYERRSKGQNYGKCEYFGCSSSEKWATGLRLEVNTPSLFMFIWIFLNAVLRWCVEHEK